MNDFPNVAPEAPSHGGRNIVIVGGAVLIIIAGFLVLKYWNQLTAAAPVALPGASQEVPQKVYTPEEKAQLLQSLQQSSSTAQASSTTPAERAKILQQVSTQNSSQSASQPSTAEKMKLLQSLQH